jgi:SAM-dependent methyltransferase
MSAADWIAFWDSKHSIYVSALHHDAHFRRIADDLAKFAPAGGVMIDYGCGEALYADRVAEPLARLILCEPAPNVRAVLAARFAGKPNIAVRKPEDIAVTAQHSIDVIVMHSVAQYLDEPDLVRLIGEFHRLLRPGGLLVLGDIVPRRLSAFGDAFELIQFGAREGFTFAAFGGLLRTLFSRYWRLRRSLGLARYNEDEIVARLTAAGFSAERAGSNIGHNNKRMTFLAHVR